MVCRPCAYSSQHNQARGCRGILERNLRCGSLCQQLYVRSQCACKQRHMCLHGCKAAGMVRAMLQAWVICSVCIRAWPEWLWCWWSIGRNGVGERYTLVFGSLKGHCCSLCVHMLDLSTKGRGCRSTCKLVLQPWLAWQGNQAEEGNASIGLVVAHANGHF